MNKDQPYTNRELDHYFGEVNQRLDKIILQTTRTNGRVGKLEAWRTGIVMVVGVFLIIVLPLAFYAYRQDLELLKERIEKLNR